MATWRLGDLATWREMPFDIPNGWEWLKLGELCTKTGSGSTPNGGQTAYTESGIPFLRSQNVYDDGLRLDGVAYIPETIHQWMIGTAVFPGDLLLNIRRLALIILWSDNMKTNIDNYYLIQKDYTCPKYRL